MGTRVDPNGDVHYIDDSTGQSMNNQTGPGGISQTSEDVGLGSRNGPMTYGQYAQTFVDPNQQPNQYAIEGMRKRVNRVGYFFGWPIWKIQYLYMSMRNDVEESSGKTARSTGMSCMTPARPKAMTRLIFKMFMNLFSVFIYGFPLLIFRGLTRHTWANP
jgi:hypothetical protein